MEYYWKVGWFLHIVITSSVIGWVLSILLFLSTTTRQSPLDKNIGGTEIMFSISFHISLELLVLFSRMLIVIVSYIHAYAICIIYYLFHDEFEFIICSVTQVVAQCRIGESSCKICEQSAISICARFKPRLAWQQRSRTMWWRKGWQLLWL